MLYCNLVIDMKEININDHLSVANGNMAFLAAVDRPRLFDACVQLEQTLMRNYDIIGWVYPVKSIFIF